MADREYAQRADAEPNAIVARGACGCAWTAEDIARGRPCENGCAGPNAAPEERRTQETDAHTKAAWGAFDELAKQSSATIDSLLDSCAKLRDALEHARRELAEARQCATVPEVVYEPEPAPPPFIPVALAGVEEPDWHLTDEEMSAEASE